MLRDFPVKWQLGISFATVVGALISGPTQDVGGVNDRSLSLILAVDEWDLSRSVVLQSLNDASATHDRVGLDGVKESAKRLQEGAGKSKQFFNTVHDTAKLKALESIQAYFNTFYSLGKTMATNYMRDGMDAGSALMQGSDHAPGFDKASEALSVQLTNFRQNQITKAQTTSLHAFSSTYANQQIIVIGGFIASVLGAVFSALIVRERLLLSGRDALGEEAR